MLLTYVDSCKSHDVFTTKSNLDSFPFSNFTTAAFYGALGKERSLPQSWVWLLLYQMIWSLKKDNSIKAPESFFRLVSELEKIGFSAPSKFDDIVTQTRDKKSTIRGPSFDLAGLIGVNAAVTSFEYEAATTNQSKDIVFEKLITFTKYALMQCHSDNKHFILIDGLDRVLFTNKGDLSPIASLIDQSSSLNSELKVNEVPIKVIIVCRKDLFDRLPLYNSNAIKQSYSEELRWFTDARDHNKNELVFLANHRASLFLGREINIFNEAFNENIEITTSTTTRTYLVLTYILWHTRNTPRDFLMALRYIQGAHDPKNEKVTDKEIVEGLSNYAHDYFYDEIKDELMGYFDPDSIDKLFSIFISYGKYRMPTRDVIEKLEKGGFEKGTAEKMLRILFDCSAIGHIYYNEARKKETNVSKHYRAQSRFNPNHDLILHRALWKPFGFV